MAEPFPRFLKDYPDLTPFVLSNVQLTGTTIGNGAYGIVEEVVLCGAAKTVHAILDSNSEIVTAQFVKELHFMSTLRHANIVQFLGVCCFQGSRLPALVMEQLLTSLHDLLDPPGDAKRPPDVLKQLTYFTMGLKCSVLHNVASGLAYLHEKLPPIIHRDLSAKNVLLTSQLVAKIADLGMARIIDVAQMRAMTRAPGAAAYMPPEASAPSASDEQKSDYDASIDVFSFGIITIFTIGETFPCTPLAPNYTDKRSGSLVALTELQRRSRYMQNVLSKLSACGEPSEDHPLIKVIQQCLQNIPAKRPAICDVLRLIEHARVEIKDEGDEANKCALVQALQNQRKTQGYWSQDLQQQLHSVSQQLTNKNAEMSAAEETIRREREMGETSRREIGRLEDLLKQRDIETQAKRRELTQAHEQLRELELYCGQRIDYLERQLGSSEALVAEFQTSLETPKPKTPNAATKPRTTSRPKQQLNVQCHEQKKAPCTMLRGSATTDHQFAYFIPWNSNSVYRYQWSSEKWTKLPPCLSSASALVIIDGELTCVGGMYGSNVTNKLLTLRQSRWVDEYPPMNTPRSQAAVVSTSNSLFVIGGYNDEWIATVELFQARSRKWYGLSNLPRALLTPSATICDGKLYVIGDSGDGYMCSLPAQSSVEQPSITWTPLPHLPVTASTAATLHGQLVAIGGTQSKCLYQLVNGQWLEIGSMSSGKKLCLVVSPSSDKMMIVGGWRGGLLRGLFGGISDKVEVCTVV